MVAVMTTSLLLPAFPTASEHRVRTAGTRSARACVGRLPPATLPLMGRRRHVPDPRAHDRRGAGALGGGGCARVERVG
eukprot:3396766-Rhodomonas_salina.1